MKLKHILIVCSSLFFATLSFGQQTAMQLDEAHRLAQEYYPLIKDVALINAVEQVNLDIIDKNSLPKISLHGVGQLQTENVEFPSASGALAAPLETYNVYVNAEYNVYDGGIKKANKAIQKATSNVERSSYQVQTQNVKSRVNNLFFAIDLYRKQQQILNASLAELTANINTLETSFRNGKVLESDVAKLKVKRLELKAEYTDITGSLKAYIAMLSHLIGKELPEDIQLIIPEVVADTTAVTRPEQQLFDSQKSLLNAQEASIAASLKPKLTAFAQTGIGNPNPVNFSDFNTSTYALGGLKLTWNFLDFGKHKKQKKLLKIQQDQVEVDQEMFLFDVQSDAKEYQQKITDLETQIEQNTTIVALQKDILNQSKVQLDNGVINSSEYVTQTNALIKAEQNLEFTKIKLKQTKVDYLMLLGKL